VFARGGEEERRAWRFLLAWVGATLVFFSLSGGKRGVYVLPALPAAALLVADALWRTALEARRVPPPFHVATAAIGVALAGAGAWVARADPLRDASASLVTGLAAIAITLAGFGAAIALARCAPCCARTDRVAGGGGGAAARPFVGTGRRAIREVAARPRLPRCWSPVRAGLVGDRALLGGSPTTAAAARVARGPADVERLRPRAALIVRRRSSASRRWRGALPRARGTSRPAVAARRGAGGDTAVTTRLSPVGCSASIAGFAHPSDVAPAKGAPTAPPDVLNRIGDQIALPVVKAPRASGRSTSASCATRPA
jgi:hypothetical protein